MAEITWAHRPVTSAKARICIECSKIIPAEEPHRMGFQDERHPQGYPKQQEWAVHAHNHCHA